MKYFIAVNGKVYADIYKNRRRRRFDLEQFSIKNEFEDKNAAHLLSHVLEERYPLIFYGKS